MRGGYRPNSGPPKGTKYRPRAPKSEGAVKPKRTRQPRKPPGIPAEIKAEAAAENLEPLAYMLKVMNDPGADNGRRDRMAIAAAPFLHPRKGEGAGKKEDKADRAKAAGGGKFRAGTPPQIKLVERK